MRGPGSRDTALQVVVSGNGKCGKGPNGPTVGICWKDGLGVLWRGIVATLFQEVFCRLAGACCGSVQFLPSYLFLFSALSRFRGRGLVFLAN